MSSDDIGQNLKALMRSLKMKGYELSQASGVDEGTISRIRNGHYNPRMDTLERLANALGVGVASFFTGRLEPVEDEPPPALRPIFEQLPLEDQEAVLDFAFYRFQKHLKEQLRGGEEAATRLRAVGDSRSSVHGPGDKVDYPLHQLQGAGGFTSRPARVAS